ncbi:DUF2189 domain-containing protein [Inhella gelatinilytica]|uniref:DUF2189 domain-containing protein n=1 Tax=Inhella gelatinilytica TaxID=2795030 RepID=A0A931NBN2_9BURK|nr:DUF2189 domain-containing protein [Inhella gelatinilytica]MBH9553758.1 DUF2189 domain-containing protein [Inhella gelatinilytica]
MNNAAPSPVGAPSPANSPTPSSGVFSIPLHPLSWRQPFEWLRLGVRDFLRAPFIGLFFGGAFMVMGWALLKAYERMPAYVLALAAGFLLLGPVLCLGLYRISQTLEAGGKPDFGDALLAFESRIGPLALFSMVLLVLEMVWGRAALVVFAVSFDGMPDFKGSLMALLNPENLGFIVAYCSVGAVFAGLIFALSVVSIPMLLDRPVDAVTAALTSLRLVLTQPGVMLLWGALITLLIGLALLPWFAGLPVVAPILGHASWHAYRAAVGVGAVDTPAQSPA